MKPKLYEDTEPGHCTSILLAVVPLRCCMLIGECPPLSGGSNFDLCARVLCPVLFNLGVIVGLHGMRAGQPWVMCRVALPNGSSIWCGGAALLAMALDSGREGAAIGMCAAWWRPEHAPIKQLKFLPAHLCELCAS